MPDAAPRSTSRIAIQGCNSPWFPRKAEPRSFAKKKKPQLIAGERARALVQPEKFLAVAWACAAPAQLPRLAHRGGLGARRLHEEQRTVALGCLDAGEVMEHGALRLGEVARRHAFASRAQALHVGDHAA